MPSGLNHPIRDFYEDQTEDKVYTLANGVPVSHAYSSQRAGEQGPLLLQDHHLIEILASQNRQRIPERTVHAKGAGAHGTFKCTKSLEDICMAEIFSKEGYECPITARFSTVGGHQGSADTVRCPRGFSVKFKTENGNMDWVFNNTPIFFLRDPAKFPHFIHTQQHDPQSNMQHFEDATHFWHYASENPESVHQFMILFGDRGIPSSYRKMQGYSGHPFKMVNKSGAWVYVQFHCLSQQGVDFLTQDEGEKTAGKSPNATSKDLFDAIEAGDYPKWKCYVQVMTPEQAEKYKYNVFDLTKVWPHADFPLREYGEMTLTHNPANYNSEVESVAFSPSHLLPGIEPSADPVLQSRLFAYPDAHKYRLGINYQHLPVNQHLNKKAGNFQRDGAMSFYSQGSRPNYISSIKPIDFVDAPYQLNKVHNKFVGEAVSFLTDLQPIDFEQPRLLWTKVYDEAARERFIKNVAGHWENVPKANRHILQKQLAIFAEVDPEIAAGLSKASGITDYPKSIEGLNFNGIRNTVYKPRNVNAHGYSGGHANGHPSDNALTATPTIANGV